MAEFLNSDAALRQFVNSLTECAIFTLDVDGNIASWTPGAALLKGYEAAEILGRHFSLFYTPQARALGHPERELAVVRSLGRYEEEGWRVRKDGTHFWAHIVIRPLFDEASMLRGFGKIVRDFTARKQAADDASNVMALLEFTARTDYLTGLENRRAFDSAFSLSLANARRGGENLSLAMIDLDNFKKYNDDLGHVAGDLFLSRAAMAWRATLRPGDMMARYGGEEFVAILRGADLAAACGCVARLRAATPPPLTCSAGVAQWDGSESADELLGRADRALYQAKEYGRDLLVAAGPKRQEPSAGPAMAAAEKDG